MKNLIYFFILALIITGCHTTKKASKSFVDTEAKTEINQTVSSSYDAKLVNDIISALNVKITTKEYFPPAGDTGADQKQGALKSETTIEASAETKDKSTADVKQGQEIKANIKKAEESRTRTEVKEKPAPDPKRWMWLFFIFVLSTAIFIYPYKSKVFAWIKSVLSLISKKGKI